MYICSSCFQHFKSTTSFDKHRVNKFVQGLPPGSKQPRRCLNETEMLERGMSKGRSGWITTRNTRSFKGDN